MFCFKFFFNANDYDVYYVYISLWQKKKFVKKSSGFINELFPEYFSVIFILYQTCQRYELLHNNSRRIPTCLWLSRRNLHKHGKYINAPGDERDKRERSGPAESWADAGRITVRTAFVPRLRKKFVHDGRFKLSLSLSFAPALSLSLFLFQIVIRPRKLRSIYTGHGSRIRCSSHSLAPSFSCRCGKQCKQIFRGLAP